MTAFKRVETAAPRRNGKADSLFRLLRSDRYGTVSLFQYRAHQEPRTWYAKIALARDIGDGKRRKSRNRIVRKLDTKLEYEAETRALDLYEVMKGQAATGRPTPKTVAECLREFQRAIPKLELKDAARVKGVIRNYALPFFSQRYPALVIADIGRPETSRPVIRAYNAWRKLQGMGKLGTHTERRDIEPSNNTLHKEAPALDHFFDFCLGKDWIAEAPKLERPKLERNARMVWYEKEQLAKIVRFLETYGYEQGRIHPKIRYYRKLAACAFLTLISFGLRPGSELYNLRWRNVFVPPNNPNLIAFNMDWIKSKTQKRDPVAPSNYTAILDKLAHLTLGLKTWQEAKDTFPNAHLFSHWPERKSMAGKPVGHFDNPWHEVLKATNLFREGESNPCYALRHTFINLCLYDSRISIDWIVHQCGTTLETIQRAYRHTLAHRHNVAFLSKSNAPLGLPFL